MSSRNARSDKQFIEIGPIRIAPFDQGEFPFPAPALHPLFMGDTVFDCIAAFGPDQAVEATFSAEIGAGSIAVLEYSGGKVGGHANIHCAAIAVGHDVDPAALALAIHGA